MIRRLASLGISLGYWLVTGKLEEPDHCVILYYHGVTRKQAPRFRRHMQWLKSRYRLISLGSLLRGERVEGSVCITFDDALDNVRQNALPILRDLQIPATVFAVAGNLGDKPRWTMADSHPDREEPLSTGEQLKEYPPDLIEIGSHSMTHADLSTLSGPALLAELTESKRTLEGLLGREVVSLAVPFGEYNDETIRAASMAGYKLVVTCDPVCFRAGDSTMSVGRFKASPDDWNDELRVKAKGMQAWRARWHRLKGMQAARSTGRTGAATSLST